MIRQRGAVLVESFFALTMQLIAIYGSIQLGMVGLAQLTADGGAFVATHQKAISGSSTQYEDGVTLAKNANPQLNQGNVQIPEPTYGQPPSNAEGPSAENYYLNNSSGRHGGVSMVLPVQTVGFVINSNVAKLVLSAISDTVGVTGIAIDPAFQLINGHFDTAGNEFNSAGAFSTASDPLANGTNTPPFFMGFNYIQYCPFTDTNPWSTCPSGSPLFANLSLAEYLDDDNWGLPENGVTPDQTAVFWHARLHQSVYAALAANLANASSLADYQKYLNPLVQLPTNPVACAQSFVVTDVGSSTQTGGKQTNLLSPGGNPALCALY